MYSRKMICADKSFFRDFEGAALCGALFEGTPYHARRIHPLRPQVCGKLSALFEKRGFQTRHKSFDSRKSRQDVACDLLRFEGAALCGALFEGTPYHARRIHPLRPQVCGKLSALFEKRGFQTRHKSFDSRKSRQDVACDLLRSEGKPERLSPLSAIFKGTHSNKSRTFTLSVRQGIAKLSEKVKSVVFAFSRDYLGSRKMICADKSFFRDLRALPSAGFDIAHAFVSKTFNRSILGSSVPVIWQPFSLA